MGVRTPMGTSAESKGNNKGTSGVLEVFLNDDPGRSQNRSHDMPLISDCCRYLLLRSGDTRSEVSMPGALLTVVMCTERRLRSGCHDRLDAVLFSGCQDWQVLYCGRGNSQIGTATD